MLLPLWLLLKFVSLLESSLCQNARILDKRFPASIIILFKFKCRLPPCKCDAEMLLSKMTFLSSCFKMLYLLLYIVVFANLMELVLLYLWKMFTAQEFYMFIVVPNKVREIFVYQRKRSFSYLLLIMCGDVEKCPGLTGSNIQDLFKQKGLKVFHQYIRGLFHNIAKLSYFLHTHKHTHIFSQWNAHQ